MTEWVTVKIPLELAKEIDAILKVKGYTSRADFAKDAIRRFLEHLLEA
jgi:metal-responsive CopG/Arc/MetJ family transcriptional regulator